MANDVGIACAPVLIRTVFFCVVLLSGIWIAAAQSTEQAFPTAVTENEINGTVRPRDVGDPRLTTYFYTFNGGQGDLFLNVLTKNFTGDIDLFVGDGLRPLTKIVVYADLQSTETGRVIYLRKPEKLLLRVSGRTPNEEVAEFRLKFAGSFIAAAPSEDMPPKLPEVRVSDEQGIRVNSVGTILPPLKTKDEVSSEVAKQEEKPVETAVVDKPVSDETKVSEDVSSKPVVVVTDELEKTKPPAVIRTARRPLRRGRRPPARTPPLNAEKPVADAVKPDSEIPTPARTRAARPKPPDPMANIQLLIMFKDGRKIERSMTDVLRFTVDRGMLTVISRNGTISRYSITDVESVSIK